MLTVQNINQYYGGSHILRDVSLTATPGKVTVLLGRNGVGKTTLLKSLMGLVPIKSGSIQFDGKPIDKATPEQIWIRDIATRLPFGKVLVAIANKHARQLWAMLARGEHYDADAWLKHPMVQRPASRRRPHAP